MASNGQQQKPVRREDSGGRGRAPRHQCHGGGNGHSQGFGEDNEKHQKVSVMSD